MMVLRRLAKWGRKSLLNFILLSEIIVSVPMLLVLCLENYDEGTLTVRWAFWILEVALMAGVAIGIPTWYLFVNRRVGFPSAKRPTEPQQRSKPKE
jgi:hypothetical protein